MSKALTSRAVGSDLSLFSSSIRYISACDHPADDVTLLLRRVRCQFVPGTFVDQQIDQRQPPRLVDRLGQQFSITRIVEFRIRLIHWRGPHLDSQNEVFDSPNEVLGSANSLAMRLKFSACAIHRSMLAEGKASSR